MYPAIATQLHPTFNKPGAVIPDFLKSTTVPKVKDEKEVTADTVVFNSSRQVWWKCPEAGV